jgi:hypothetical protein
MNQSIHQMKFYFYNRYTLCLIKKQLISALILCSEYMNLIFEIMIEHSPGNEYCLYYIEENFQFEIESLDSKL